MEDNLFDSITGIRKARQKYNRQMFESGISTFYELEEAEEHTFQDGALDRKHKELIALAVGIANGCYG